jgi:hypothetical protein
VNDNPLHRLPIILTDEQRKQIQELINLNKFCEAQKIILNIIEILQ